MSLLVKYKAQIITPSPCMYVHRYTCDNIYLERYVVQSLPNYTIFYNKQTKHSFILSSMLSENYTISHLIFVLICEAPWNTSSRPSFWQNRTHSLSFLFFIIIVVVSYIENILWVLFKSLYFHLIINDYDEMKFSLRIVMSSSLLSYISVIRIFTS